MERPMCLLDCTSPFGYLEKFLEKFNVSMHKPDHASVLPDRIDPIPMPDTPREAEMLLLLLDMGFYPQIVPALSEKIRPDEG
jgi:hypothetical protein